MNIKLWITGLAIAMMGTSSAFAKDIFTAEVQVDGVTQMIGYNKILNVADQYESENMRKIFPNYSDTSVVSAKLDLRSVPVNLSYAQNSSTLVFKIPSLGIERTYTGSTREESKEKFIDALEGMDKDLLKALTKEWGKELTS